MALRAVIERVKELVEEFLEGRSEKRRRLLLLTLVAAHKLRQRGEEITAENIAREARRLIQRSEWGVEEEEYTEALAADLLEELVDMGVLEPSPEVLEELGRRYRFKSYGEEGDAGEATLQALTPLLLKIA